MGAGAAVAGGAGAGGAAGAGAAGTGSHGTVVVAGAGEGAGAGADGADAAVQNVPPHLLHWSLVSEHHAPAALHIAVPKEAQPPW